MGDMNDDASAERGSQTPLIFAGVAAFIAVIGLVIVFSRDTDSTASSTAATTESIGDFEFATIDGGTTSLDDYRGEALVVNYFAAWCPPCRAELPDFESVHQDLSDEVTFIGISRDTTQSAWLSLIDETGVTFDTVYEGSIRGSFDFAGGFGMPTTVFINPDGEIVHVITAPLDDEQLRELIETHL